MFGSQLSIKKDVEMQKIKLL